MRLGEEHDIHSPSFVFTHTENDNFGADEACPEFELDIMQYGVFLEGRIGIQENPTILMSSSFRKILSVLPEIYRGEGIVRAVCPDIFPTPFRLVRPQSRQ